MNTYVGQILADDLRSTLGKNILTVVKSLESIDLTNSTHSLESTSELENLLDLYFLGTFLGIVGKFG